MPDAVKYADANAALAEVQKLLNGLKDHKDYLELKCYEDQDLILLINPWRDRSVAFIAYKEGIINRDLFKNLSGVLLPQQYSAIYHKKTKKLEVLWTAYKLGASSEEIYGRDFKFVFGEKEFICHFSNSSKLLIDIAKHAAYLQISETAFRNLQSFSAYANISDKDKSPKLGKPVSFWIENLEGSPEDWLDIVKHVNFYLKYYDSKSPHVIIHETIEQKANDKVRYLEGNFPKIIRSKNLNANLLSLWLAAYDHDITTKFLLYYRILEYVSSLYLQQKQRQALLKVLNSPSALSSLEGTLDSVASIVREDNSNEIDRYLKMFEELVDRKKIFDEICCNDPAFTTDTTFDGGLEIKAVLSTGQTEETFGSKGMQLVARALRQIRHGLAHGGEAQSGRLILPTSENFARLIPWVHVAMVAAGEVVVYEHLA